MAFDPNCEDTKKAIKEAVESALKDANDEKNRILGKNSELLDKLKKAKKGQEIDPSDYADLEKELEKTQDKLKVAEKTAKKATADAEKATKSYEGESKVVHDLLVDNGLSKALLDNGVKTPQYLKAAKALLKSQVTLEADGENRVAKVGDKTLGDFVKEWSGSDDGKAFVDAPANSGGGGGGNKGGTPNNEDLAKLTPEARLDHINSQGEGK